MKIYAGIDGGGTGTTLRIENVEGTFSKEYKLGAFNLNSVGKEQFKKRLEEITSKIKECGSCCTLCIGAAGISNFETRSLIEEHMNTNLPDTKLTLMGDHEIALYGATGGKTGIILIAGTGSICSGMLEDQSVIRAGGYGHLIDDLGSGYSIGKDALYAIMCGEDGRREKTILKELILDKLKVSSISEIIKVVHESSDKSIVASLSREVEVAASKGDCVALAILERNACYLLELVKTVYTRMYASENLCKEKKIMLTLMGGMLINPTKLKEFLVEKIQAELPMVVVANPILNAVEGALLVAKEN